MSRLCFLLGLVVCLLAACSQSGAPALVPGMSLGGTLGSELVLQSDVERDGARRLVWASSGDRLELRVTPVPDDGAAAQLVADREHLLAAVFEQPYSTYKLGPMSERRCPDGLRPTPVDLKQSGLKGHAYFLSATRDFVFGGCSSESGDLVSVYANLWCSTHLEVFELRYYSAPPQGLANRQGLVDSLQCLAVR